MDASGRRLLVVHGSPRAGGNTDQLIAQALEQLEALGPVEVRHIWANRLKARPCLACGGCDATGLCVIGDDLAEVYLGARWAELMLVGTPVFFASVTAQLKVVIDRHQCAWVAKYRLGRPWNDGAVGRRALLLAAGAMHIPSHLRQARDVVRSWLKVLNYELAADVMLPGVDAPGDALLAPGIDERLAAAALELWRVAPGASPAPGGRC
jgi:NAD(P)H-dependent FMN reductase